LALLAAAYIYYDLYWKRRLLPPGPTPWLFFGNLFHFMFYRSIDEMFLAWKQKYGKIITFWIGPIPLVMVADVEMMREYFVQNADVFSNRWRNHATDCFMGGPYGIIQIDGNKWKEQRRFTLRVLRDFGVGRALIEQRILTEVDYFVDYLQAKCEHGEEVDICAMHSVCVG
uniref:Cytochrome P450 n=1 Tax=Gongylonema pulchrum TaxID=637853 RepID=A0A183F140_9BILA